MTDREHETDRLAEYRAIIDSLSDEVLTSRQPPDQRLLLHSDRELKIFYAPFDYLSRSARVAIVGVTPGRSQMYCGLREARDRLRTGASFTEASFAAKRAAAFSGPMRDPLVNMLDHIGLHTWLGIPSCRLLFDSCHNLVHMTSALRYPTFCADQNYRGTQPSMLEHPLLRGVVEKYLVSEVRVLSNAVFVPLGPSVAEVFDRLTRVGIVARERVLSGLPHPSPANVERILYFLGRKDAKHLSGKTNARRIDTNRKVLLERVSALPQAVASL